MFKYISTFNFDFCRLLFTVSPLFGVAHHKCTWIFFWGSNIPPPGKVSPDNFGRTWTPDNFGGDNFGRTGPPDNLGRTGPSENSKQKNIRLCSKNNENPSTLRLWLSMVDQRTKLPQAAGITTIDGISSHGAWRKKVGRKTNLLKKHISRK